jgi:hypothetical protein
VIFARLNTPAHDVLARLEDSPPKPYLTELSVDDAVATALRLRQERCAKAAALQNANCSRTNRHS